MLITTKNNLSEDQYAGLHVLKRSPLPAVLTANLFRDAANVKNLRKRKTIQGDEEELMDASVTDELIADHEWESLLHTFEYEADELSPGDAESDDLWERLSSTRWLKSSAPLDDSRQSSGSESGDSASETATA